MAKALVSTDYNFPGQTGVYHGKVRDVYSIGDDTLVMIATDRISARSEEHTSELQSPS